MQDYRTGAWRAVCVAVAVMGAGRTEAVELDSLPELTVDVLALEPVVAKPPQFLFGYVGGAVVNTGRFIGGDERLTFPLPYLYFNYNDRLYWSIASVGGWLWHSDDRAFKIGLMAKARGGVDGKYAPYPGIADRDASADGGINLSWRARPLTIGASWLTDIGGRSHGQSASLRLSVPLRLGERWTMTPTVAADWMDRELVDYYYGVPAAQTAGGAPLYAGKSNVNLRAAWSLAYRLPKGWSLHGSLSYTRLGDGLDDSPLTERRDNLLVLVGAGWSFLHVGR